MFVNLRACLINDAMTDHFLCISRKTIRLGIPRTCKRVNVQAPQSRHHLVRPIWASQWNSNVRLHAKHVGWLGRTAKIYKRGRVAPAELRKMRHDPKGAKAFRDGASDHPAPCQLMVQLSPYGKAGALHFLGGREDGSPFAGERDAVRQAIQ